MKLLVFLCLIIVYTNVFAEWERIYLSSEGINLFDISIEPNSKNYAIAVGESGCVRTTSDSGTTWVSRKFPTSKNIISVACIDSTTALFVTDDDQIFKTGDFGLSFTKIDISLANKILNVSYLANGDCFLLGKNGLLMRSKDKGLNWETIITNTTVNLNQIAMLAPEKFYIAGNSGTLLKSVDNGSNWTKINTDINLNYFNIQLIGSNFITIMGDSLNVIISSDGGSTWRKKCITDNYSNLYIRPSIISFFWINENIANIRVLDLYAGYPRLYEYMTNDSGNSWNYKRLDGQIINPPYIGTTLKKYVFFDKDFGLGVGDNGEIAKANFGEDNYLVYKNLSQYKSNNLLAIDAFDAQNIAIVEMYLNSGMMVSSNGGEEWMNVPLKMKSSDSGSLNIADISWKSKDNMQLLTNSWKYYQEGSTTYFVPRGNLFSSSDLFMTYSTFENKVIKGFFTMSMIDNNYGFIYSPSDSINYTTNGGKDWGLIMIDDSAANSGSISSPAPGIFYVLRGQGFYPDYRTYLIRSYDNGNKWDKVNNDTLYTFFLRIYFIEPTIGFALYQKDTIINNVTYSNAQIFKTTDGADNWVSVYNSYTIGSYSNFLREIKFSDNNNGIVVGDDRQILRTTNGGSDWIADSVDFLEVYENIKDVCYPTSGTAYAITSMNKVLKFTDFTDVNENNILSSSIVLIPNPARDYIEISGSRVILSEAKDRGIRIYDVLGIEQSTSPQPLSILGEGKMHIDISHLAHGIYFVRVGDIVRKFVKM